MGAHQVSMYNSSGMNVFQSSLMWDQKDYFYKSINIDRRRKHLPEFDIRNTE